MYKRSAYDTRNTYVRTYKKRREKRSKNQNTSDKEKEKHYIKLTYLLTDNTSKHFKQLTNAIIGTFFNVPYK